jgi:hypothetical protein
MLVIGTSAVVQPAASLPHVAKEHGAAVVEVNIEKAFSSADHFLQGKAGTVLPELISEIKKEELNPRPDCWRNENASHVHDGGAERSGDGSAAAVQRFSRRGWIAG